ncbi:MAG: adenylate/guanylate cyclase domain-containing protein, partial [Spirochaetota bacterium]
MEPSIRGDPSLRGNQAGAPTDPDGGEGRLREGERRTVTVLFADMQGFTALSERLDPEEMDALMNRVFSRFESIVKSRGGSVEKYIGDALVAVFGYPALHEDDPVRAVECALEFGEALTAKAEDREAGKDVPVAPMPSFRTGIHTGIVATGRRGGQEVVTGHAMAIAARLESAADDGGILVSDPVREHC